MFAQQLSELQQKKKTEADYLDFGLVYFRSAWCPTVVEASLARLVPERREGAEGGPETERGWDGVIHAPPETSGL